MQKKLYLPNSIINPFIPNLNSIIKKYLFIITDNSSLNEIFPNDLVFCIYKRSPNLKDLMVCSDPYSTRWFKKIDQDPSCISR